MYYYKENMAREELSNDVDIVCSLIRESIEQYFSINDSEWKQSFFLDKLSSKKKDDVYYSVLALRYCGTKKAIPCLKKTLFHSMNAVRTASILTLGLLSGEKLTGFYVDLLNNPQYKEKSYVLLVIRDYADKTAIDAVLQYIEKNKKNIKSRQSTNNETVHAAMYLNKYIHDYPEVESAFDFLMSVWPEIDGGVSRRYKKSKKGLVLRTPEENLKFKDDNLKQNSKYNMVEVMEMIDQLELKE